VNFDHLGAQAVKLLVTRGEGTTKGPKHLLSVFPNDGDQRVAQALWVQPIGQLLDAWNR
jgi:hypothetical protein